MSGQNELSVSLTVQGICEKRVHSYSTSQYTTVIVHTSLSFNSALIRIGIFTLGIYYISLISCAVPLFLQSHLCFTYSKQYIRSSYISFVETARWQYYLFPLCESIRSQLCVFLHFSTRTYSDGYRGLGRVWLKLMIPSILIVALDGTSVHVTNNWHHSVTKHIWSKLLFYDVFPVEKSVHASNLCVRSK